MIFHTLFPTRCTLYIFLLFKQNFFQRGLDFHAILTKSRERLKSRYFRESLIKYVLYRVQFLMPELLFRQQLHAAVQHPFLKYIFFFFFSIFQNSNIIEHIKFRHRLIHHLMKRILYSAEKRSIYSQSKNIT